MDQRGSGPWSRLDRQTHYVSLKKLATKTHQKDFVNHLQYHFKSKIVDLYLIASEYGLSSIHWKKQPIPMVHQLKGTAPQVKVLDLAQKQLGEYFSGKRKKFDLPVDIIGTDFQIQVWKELAQIPYGKTVSYSNIAKKIKNPKAVRAVGSANGKNPLCIIVPCHRVIASTGKLGGYAGGLQLKKALLELEKN
jgi:methylated-DNA-[protein]-cysteine S-methyltransferase